MRTRGASSCVLKTPTALPDWTSIVSLFEPLQGLRRSGRSLPVARRLARAAVDDQLAGLLGDVGVEVVLEHPERGFLGPAAAAQLVSPRGADRSGRRQDAGAHGAIIWVRPGRVDAPPGHRSPFERRSREERRAASRSGASRGRGSRAGRRGEIRPRTARWGREDVSGRRNSIAWKAASISIARTRLEVSDDRGELARRDRRHRDVVLLVGGGRDRVDRGGMRERPCSPTRGPPR